MGLTDIFKNIKTMSNPKKMGELIVEKQIEIYYQYKAKYPHEEPHFWLANTYLSRRRTRGDNTNDPALQIVAHTETFLCACLPEPDNARSLGLYILYKELPEVILKYPEFEREYSQLIKGLIDMDGNPKKNIMDYYKKYNPKSAKMKSSDTGEFGNFSQTTFPTIN